MYTIYNHHYTPFFFSPRPYSSTIHRRPSFLALHFIFIEKRSALWDVHPSTLVRTSDSTRINASKNTHTYTHVPSFLFTNTSFRDTGPFAFTSVDTCRRQCVTKLDQPDPRINFSTSSELSQKTRNTLHHQQLYTRLRASLLLPLSETTSLESETQRQKTSQECRESWVAQVGGSNILRTIVSRYEWTVRPVNRMQDLTCTCPLYPHQTQELSPSHPRLLKASEAPGPDPRESLAFLVPSNTIGHREIQL